MSIEFQNAHCDGHLVYYSDCQFCVTAQHEAEGRYQPVADASVIAGAVEKLVGDALRKANGKPRLTLVPPQLDEGAARALDYGADKHGQNQWRVGLSWSLTMDSLLRHAKAFAEGENIDPVEKGGSGLCHLDHIAANLAFLLHHYATGSGTDDRYKPN